MPPRPNSDRAGDPLDPDSIPRKEFRSTFRGYDQLEVKAYLTVVAVELQAVLERERTESMRASQAEREVLAIESMDDEQITALLGERTGQILANARQTAADIEAEAIRRAQSIRSVAEEDSERMRAEAEAALGQQLEDNSRAEARRREDAEAVAEHAREQYHEELEEARREARLMVEEAKRVRDQIIKDLARQRRLAQRQYAALVALRDDLDGRLAAVTAGVSHGRAALEGLFDLETTLDLEAGIEGDETPAGAETQAGPEIFDIDVLEAKEAEAEGTHNDDTAAPIDLTGSPNPIGGSDSDATGNLDLGEQLGGDDRPDAAHRGSDNREVVDLGAVEMSPGGERDDPVRIESAMAAVSAGGVVEAKSDQADGLAPVVDVVPEAKVFSLAEARDANRRADRGVPMDHPALGAPDSDAGPLDKGDVRQSDIKKNDAATDGAENDGAENDGAENDGAENDGADAEESSEVGTGANANANGEGGDVLSEAVAPNQTEVGEAESGDEPRAEAAEEEDDEQSGLSPSAGVSDEVGELFARIRAGGDGSEEGVVEAAEDGGQSARSERSNPPSATANGVEKNPVQDNQVETNPVENNPAETNNRAAAAEVATARRQASPTSPARNGAAAVFVGDELATRRGNDLSGLDRKLTRRLKRLLSDDQNTLLDQLRRHQAGSTEAGPLPDLDAHLEQYRSTELVEVVRAVELGATVVTPGAEPSPGLIGELSDALIRRLVEPLHAGLASAVEAAAEVEEETVARVRTCYRETKLQRVRNLAAEAVTGAYARGMAAAIDPGAPVAWVLTADSCGDLCEANAAADPVAQGDSFPSGEAWPPAHPQCGCLVVPAPS